MENISNNNIRTDTGDFINSDNTNNHFNPISLDFTELQFNVMSEIHSKLFNDKSGRKFTKEEVRRLLNYPRENSKQIRQASLYLATASSYYMRLVFYMSSMLTLDNILTPINVTKKDIKSKKFKDNYKKANNYTEKFNIKHELLKVLLTIMIEDTYFGYERHTKNSFMLQQLPAERCRITGLEDGVFIFDFDFTYFNGKEKLLVNYPREFTTLYNKYRRTHSPWQPLNTKKAVCFKFREDLSYALPPFVSVFEDLIGLEDLKDLEDTRDKLENFKLLLQKIPYKKDPKSEKDLLISAPSVKMFHDNIKTILPSQIGLVSTPMEIEDFSFEPKNNRVKESIKDAKERVYDGFGTSSGLFNSGNQSSATLNRAIQTDEAMMFRLLRQFERFFNKRLKEFVDAKVDYGFKLVFPDLTFYNREDQLDLYIKTAQYGFPKTLVASAMGINTNELVGMSLLENEFLDLEEHLRPLQSSHTQSGNSKGQDSENKAGREETKASKLSDKGLETRENNSNEERDAR